MQDLRNNKKRFGGAMILLAGDFRQILPVVPRSTPADELNAYFCPFYGNTLKHLN